MSPHKYRDADFDDLAALHVNAVRWQMYEQPSNKRPYSEWIAEELDDLALTLDASAARGIKLAHNARIFLGEFSAVRWAPGAADYLDGIISLAEEYGWDWTYHAFRESPVWSVEHENLPYDLKNHPVATSPTDRMLVLQKYLAKKPGVPVSPPFNKA